MRACNDACHELPLASFIHHFVASPMTKRRASFHSIRKFIRWFSYHLVVFIWMLLVIGSNESIQSMRLSLNLCKLCQANRQQNEESMILCILLNAFT